MRTRICKSFTFEAAHYLPHYNGKCRNLHGHSYKIDITLEGQIRPINKHLPESLEGMVEDFSLLSIITKKEVVGRFDHTLLNESLSHTPTAEILALEVFRIISEAYSKDPGIKVYSVRVWETPTAYAEVLDD